MLLQLLLIYVIFYLSNYLITMLFQRQWIRWGYSDTVGNFHQAPIVPDKPSATCLLYQFGLNDRESEVKKDKSTTHIYIINIYTNKKS